MAKAGYESTRLLLLVKIKKERETRMQFHRLVSSINESRVFQMNFHDQVEMDFLSFKFSYCARSYSLILARKENVL